MVANDSGEIAVIGGIKIVWVADGEAELDRLERVGFIKGDVVGNGGRIF